MLRFITGFCATLAFVGLVHAETQENPSTVDAKIQAPETEEGLEFNRPSEFFRLPEKRQARVSLSPFYGSYISAYTTSNGPGKLARTIQFMGFGAEYGLNDNIGIELSSTYGMTTRKYQWRDYATRFEGLSDPILRLKGFAPLSERFRLLGEISASYSPVNAQSASRDVVGNRFSGGSALTPLVALEASLGRHWTIGAFTSYTFNGQAKFEGRDAAGRLIDSGTDSGGNISVVGAFAEAGLRMGLRPLKIGASALRRATDATITVRGNEATKDEEYNEAEVNLYSSVPFSQRFELRPTATYSTLLTRNFTDLHYTESTFFSATVSARMIF